MQAHTLRSEWTSDLHASHLSGLESSLRRLRTVEVRRWSWIFGSLLFRLNKALTMKTNKIFVKRASRDGPREAL